MLVRHACQARAVAPILSRSMISIMPDPVLLDLFQRLGLALGIGFLVGVEREWKHRETPEGQRAAGVRTHAIIGLTGGADHRHWCGFAGVQSP
jgi:hypothetical protein